RPRRRSRRPGRERGPQGRRPRQGAGAGGWQVRGSRAIRRGVVPPAPRDSGLVSSSAATVLPQRGLPRPAMLTLLTGATGLLGANLAHLLCKRGERVRALVRARSDRRGVRGLALEEVAGDVLDPASLERAMAGVRRV